MKSLPPDAFWPMHRLGEAIEVLARACGLPIHSKGLPQPDDTLVQPGGLALARWMEGAASWLGLEAELVEARYKDVDHLIFHAGPAIVRLFGAEPRFLVLIGRCQNRLRLLTIEDQRIEVEREAVRTVFCASIEAPLLPAIECALDCTGVPVRRRLRARRAILREQLGSTVIRACWLLRRAPDKKLRVHLKQTRFGYRIAVILLARALEYAFLLLSWWVVGRSVLYGHLELTWLVAWGFLILSTLPFRIASGWLSGMLGIDLGCLIKQRLLSGSLQLDPGEIRHEGAGMLLGRVIEADALEALTLEGGLLGLTAVVELIMAAFVLGFGAYGQAQILTLLAWVGLSAGLAALYLRQRRQWTQIRLKMTHALVEKLVGHRTRMAQEDPQCWYQGDDQLIERYIYLSQKLDRVSTIMKALVPRGWLVVGMATLGVAFVLGTEEPARLAVSLGGVLLTFRAFRTLVTGLAELTGAAIAWDQVAPLQRATTRTEIATTAALQSVTSRRAVPKEILLDAQSLRFQHAGHSLPVLHGCSLMIRCGDRILLEGVSGSGKSTLGTILAGLRAPSQGLLLLRGLDKPTLGLTGWRRQVASAPQFHENHILSASLAFNLMLGRQWPPRPTDLEEAEEVCRELGLGALLDRMPGGMMQFVGETGWQLSHGEKSRLYVARTILQQADLVILDESLAALDPETLRLALACVMKRVPTLLMIAHP